MTGLLLAVLLSIGFTGVWETTYGDMNLEQTGSTVTGWYAFGGMSTIEGTATDGGKMIFRYDEGNASGEGWFQLSESGDSFSGMWRADGSSVWSAWEGRKFTGQPSRWLVVLECEWQESLREHEYSFGDMLGAWLGRLPGLEIRHRFIHSYADLERFCAEAAMLPGDVWVVIASHGTEAGIALPEGTVSPARIAQALTPITNLRLVHFSCCLIMAGNTPRAILASRTDWPRDFAVSGYTTSVDWGGSAIIEFYYLDKILGQGLSPAGAAEALLHDIRFAGDASTPHNPGAGFTISTPRN